MTQDPNKKKRKMVFTISERFALLAVFAQMGVRPPPETLDRVLENSYPVLKHCTPQDLANLTQSLHVWRWGERWREGGRGGRGGLVGRGGR